MDKAAGRKTTAMAMFRFFAVSAAGEFSFGMWALAAGKGYWPLYVLVITPLECFLARFWLRKWFQVVR